MTTTRTVLLLAGCVLLAAACKRDSREGTPAATDSTGEAGRTVSILTWADDGSECRAAVVEVGPSPPRTVEEIARVPGRCGPHPGVTRSGNRVVVSAEAGGALVTAGNTTLLPPLPAPFAIGRIAVDSDGVAVAIGQFGGQPEITAADGGTGEGDVVRWSVGGEAIAYTTQGYEVEVALCGRFRWSDGGWARTGLSPLGLPEGSTPPFCGAWPDDGASALADALPVPQAGGGMLTRVPKDTPGLLPGGDWVWIEESLAGRASEWLEGESSLTPLFFTGTVPWIPIEGFQDERRKVAVLVQDGWAIACIEGKAAVLDLHREARTVWRGEQCPTFWR